VFYGILNKVIKAKLKVSNDSKRRRRCHSRCHSQRRCPRRQQELPITRNFYTLLKISFYYNIYYRGAQ